jgi:outer membrane protein TolC
VAAPVLQWNVLDFGRTRAKIAQAEAGRDEAAAKYQGAVLAALQDAETALSRFGRQRENVLSLERVQASADRSAALTRERYQAGTASMIDLLDTERSRVTAEENLAAGRAQLVADYVSLQKSLGLGWAPAKT